MNIFIVTLKLTLGIKKKKYIIVVKNIFFVIITQPKF